MKKIVLLALVALITTGCMSTNNIKPEAFGQKKRYAVVSIIGATDITDIKSANGSGSGSLVGLVSAAASKDINFTESSDKMFAATQKILDQELSKAKSFQYVTSKTVLNSSAYKKAKGEEPKFGLFTIGLAPGYKYFNDDNKPELQKIMDANHLDGVIIVNANFNYGTGGVNVAGLISVGKTRGITTLGIYAADRSLAQVWSQNIKIQSEESVGNVGGAPNFKKLYPLLEETTRSAIQQCVSTLDSTVYAEK